MLDSLAFGLLFFGLVILLAVVVTAAFGRKTDV